MQLKFEHQGKPYRCDTQDSKSIAIELDFAGPQPNLFGVQRASATVLELGEFVGQTDKGGSCNVQTLQMVPHCNGTHTETVGHIVNQDVWIGRAAINPVMVALLVTVTPQLGKQTSESYRPELKATDQVIDSEQLLKAVALVCDARTVCPEALVIRTLPNDATKLSRVYTSNDSSKDAPPFFTVEAIKAINSLGIKHLLVDFPSLDRMNDDGLLTNHHLFWSVPEETHDLTDSTERDKTVTEMVFVEDEIADGLYGLNIQVPALRSDAAPSRPIIMPLRPVVVKSKPQ